MSPEVKIRLSIILLIIFSLNIFVWILTALFLKQYPILFGLVALAYGFGLRHAMDPDHIAAIDNTTRKLIHDSKKPLATGLFFSLGHSTIVIILSLFIIFSTSFVQRNLPAFQKTGSLIGTIVSGTFLLLIGAINFVILIDLYKQWRKNKEHEAKKSVSEKHIKTSGLLIKIIKPLLKTVTASWHMYFIGLLFGLGFDTATEVGLLSISATTSSKNIPILIILLLPFAFTAGMTLIDTLDGIVMFGAYKFAHGNPTGKLYYNIILVLLSITVAFIVGGAEIVQLF